MTTENRSLSGFWRHDASDDRVLELVSVLRGAGSLIGNMGGSDAFRVTWAGDGTSRTEFVNKVVRLDFGPLKGLPAPFPGQSVDEVIGYAAHEGGHVLWSDHGFVSTVETAMDAQRSRFPLALKRAWNRNDTAARAATLREVLRIQNILEDAHVDQTVQHRWPVLGEYIRIARGRMFERNPWDLAEIANDPRPTRRQAMNLWVAVALFERDLPANMRARVRRAMLQLMELTMKSIGEADREVRSRLAVEAAIVLWREFLPEPLPASPPAAAPADNSGAPTPGDQAEGDGAGGGGAPKDDQAEADDAHGGDAPDGEDEGDSQAPDSDDQAGGDGQPGEGAPGGGDAPEGDDQAEADDEASTGGAPEGEDVAEGDGAGSGGDAPEGEDDASGDSQASDGGDAPEGEAGAEGGAQPGDGDGEGQPGAPGGMDGGTLKDLYEFDDREVVELPEHILEQVLDAIAREIEDLSESVASTLEIDARHTVATARRGEYDPDLARQAVAGVGKEVSEIRRLFQDQKDRETQHIRGQLRGKLDPGRLARVGAGDLAVFQRRQVKAQPRRAVGLLLDASGSMSRWTPVVMETAAIFAEGLIHQRGINFAAWTYSGSGYYGDQRVELTRICDRAMPQLSLKNAIAGGGTPSGPAIAAAMTLLVREPEDQKMLLHFTDGDPDDKSLVHRAVEACRKAGVSVFCIGLRGYETALALQYGPDSYRTIDTVADLPQAVRDFLKQLV